MFIPIKNLYYLLSYAWNKLTPGEPVEVAGDGPTELLQLLARVFNEATRTVLKRGLDQQYRTVARDLAGVKGKLLYSTTLRKNLLHQQKTHSAFDEFSALTLPNQILSAVLHKLIRSPALDRSLRRTSRQLLAHFPQIPPRKIQPSDFAQLRQQHSHQSYQLALSVAELLYRQLLPGESPGTYRFLDFRRDERQMSQLFETFLFQFYRREQAPYRVRRELIHWHLRPAHAPHRDYLPLMRTDLSLESATEKIIIDAKYYRRTLQEYFDKRSIQSSNLYQIFSYLLNQESAEARSRQTRGILLYPTTTADRDLVYHWEGHPLEIRTVDLSRDWREIHQRLLDLIAWDEGG